MKQHHPDLAKLTALIQKALERRGAVVTLRPAPRGASMVASYSTGEKFRVDVLEKRDRGRPRIAADVIEEARKLRADGCTPGEIGELLGVSGETVRQWLR